MSGKIRGEQIKDDSITGTDVSESSLRYTIRDVSSSSSVLDTDYCLRCTQSSSMTVTMPAKSNTTGRILVIKDALGQAQSNNITVDGFESETIDGAANYVINQNFGVAIFICDGINGWMVISR